MRTGKQILQVAKWSFIDWLMDVRQLLVLMALVCFSNYSVSSLVKYSQAKGKPMNIVEPFLANINGYYFILIIIACWLVLISDYPKMEGNNGYILIRINRMVWLAGKILAFVFAAITYVVELVAVFTLRAVHVCYMANGWSTFIKELAVELEEVGSEAFSYNIVCWVDEKIFYHYRPYQAFWKTVFLLLGMLSMFALIMMAASLGKSKMAGLIVNLILAVGGFAVLHTGSMLRIWFPAGNVMLAHQATVLIKLVPKNFSAIYFTVCCGVLLVLCVVLVRHGQVQKDGER